MKQSFDDFTKKFGGKVFGGYNADRPLNRQ